MASVLCLQAVPASPFPVNPPHTLCSHSGGEGKKGWGGCETESELPSTSFVRISVRLHPGQVSSLAYLWAGSVIHRLKKENTDLSMFATEEHLI